MNCALHPETAAVAYCRTCGKALCASCVRQGHGGGYCEDCLASRGEGAPAQPTATRGVAAGAVVSPAVQGPYPVVAGILSGFLPFGVGVMYSGEFVRALVHAGVFFGAIVAMNTVGEKNDAIGVFLGLLMAFWYF